MKINQFVSNMLNQNISEEEANSNVPPENTEQKQKVIDLLDQEETTSNVSQDAGDEEGFDELAEVLSLASLEEKQKILEELKKLPPNKRTLKSYIKKTNRYILDKQKEIEKSLQSKPEIDLQEFESLKKQSEDWKLATKELEQIGLTPTQANVIAKELLMSPETFIDTLEGVRPELIQQMMKSKTLSRMLNTTSVGNTFSEEIADDLVSASFIPEKQEEETTDQFLKRAEKFYNRFFNKSVINSPQINEDAIVSKIEASLTKKLEQLLSKPIEQKKEEPIVEKVEEASVSAEDLSEFNQDRLRDTFKVYANAYKIQNRQEMEKIVEWVNADKEFQNLAKDIGTASYDIDKASERINAIIEKFLESKKTSSTTAPINSTGSVAHNKSSEPFKGIKGLATRVVQE